MSALLVSMCIAGVAGCGAREGYAAPEQLAQPPFGTVRLYRPPGAVHRIAVLVSGDGGWGTGMDTIARDLALEDSLVAGIDGAQFLRGLEQGAACASVADPLRVLVHVVAERQHLPPALPVILVGHSAGATLVYVALAQAPPGRFAGVLTLSFCTGLDLKRPLCPAPAVHGEPVPAGLELTPGGPLTSPWVAVHGLDDRVCPAAAGEAFARAVPGASFIGLPGVDHNYRNRARWWPAFVAAYRRLAGAP
jgi:type IV secretory pathway VirJ component